MNGFGSFLYLVIEHINPDQEQQCINEPEHDDRSEYRTSADRFGNGISRKQSLIEAILKKTVRIQNRPARSIANNIRMNDPGLSAYFCCDPSQFICCKCSDNSENENPQQPSTIEESSTPATPGRKQSHDDKKHP